MSNYFLECSQKLKDSGNDINNYTLSLEYTYSYIDKFNKGEIQWFLNNINLNCSMLDKSYQTWYDKFKEYLVQPSLPKMIITDLNLDKKTEKEEEKKEKKENKVSEIENELKVENERLKIIITCQNQTINKIIRKNNEINRQNQEEFYDLLLQKDDELKELNKKFYELERTYNERIHKLGQDYQNQYEQFQNTQINIFRNIIQRQDKKIKKYKNIYQVINTIFKNTDL